MQKFFYGFIINLDDANFMYPKEKEEFLTKNCIQIPGNDDDVLTILGVELPIIDGEDVQSLMDGFEKIYQVPLIKKHIQYFDTNNLNNPMWICYSD